MHRDRIHSSPQYASSGLIPPYLVLHSSTPTVLRYSSPAFASTGEHSVATIITVIRRERFDRMTDLLMRLRKSVR